MRFLRSWLLLVAALLSAAPATAASNPARSFFIVARDGTPLAADLFLPQAAARRPTVLVFSRYGRPGDQNEAWIAAMRGAGFNAVFVDIRGTGASFGTRKVEFSAEEAGDIGDVLSWIAVQDWSDGKIAVTGNSYSADVSEWAIAQRHPALQAAVIRHAEFDVFRHLTHPGGVRNDGLLHAWGLAVRELDATTPCVQHAGACSAFSHLRPVDGADGIALLRRALRQHQHNFRPDQAVAAVAYQDDRVGPGVPYASLSAASRAAQIRDAKTPVQYWGSWLDAGTAETALERFVFMHDTPIELHLGPWVHGGSRAIDPFRNAGQPNILPRPAQIDQWIGFMRAVLVDGTVPVRRIHYWPMGASAWKETEVWPPAGIVRVTYRLAAANRIATEPTDASGAYRYRVAFDASTGSNNRWRTQVDGDVQVMGDRRAEDARLLVFDSAPLSAPMELAGSAIAEISLSADRDDAALFVYLEDVAPDGRVTYLSEGQLRLLHRAENARAAPTLSGIARSFARADARPLVPNQVERVSIPLFVTAAKIDAGHRIRFAIAGADHGNFARYPAHGPLQLSIWYGAGHETSFHVPLRPWRDE